MTTQQQEPLDRNAEILQLLINGLDPRRGLAINNFFTVKRVGGINAPDFAQNVMLGIQHPSGEAAKPCYEVRAEMNSPVPALTKLIGGQENIPALAIAKALKAGFEAVEIRNQARIAIAPNKVILLERMLSVATAKMDKADDAGRQALINAFSTAFYDSIAASVQPSASRSR